MRKFLFWFALTGWLISLIIHILSIADVDVTNKVPFVWILHIGVIVIWVPAILIMKKSRDLNKYANSKASAKPGIFYYLKIIYSSTPKWLLIIAAVGFVYAIINFNHFAASQPGTPDLQNGQYILQNHGQLIKNISEQEYHHYKANELRLFSGHWIAFYGMAMAILYPFNSNLGK